MYETYLGNDSILVRAGRKVGFGFARVLVVTDGDVTAQAKVMVGSVGGGTGMMPWARCEDLPAGAEPSWGRPITTSSAR